MAALAGTLCLVLGPGPSRAGDDGPKTPLQRLNKEMVNIRNNLKNAQMKHRNGVVESGVGSEGDSPATPMQTCCNGNLKRIKKRIVELRAAAADLGKCYEAAGNSDALFDLNFFLTDFTQFERGVGLWFEAVKPEEVYGVQEALTRSFLLMRESADKLEACETGESATGASS